MFATTDHGPSLEDAPHVWHFGNLKVVPRICEGIAVLRGIESNIMPGGTIDIDAIIKAGQDGMVNFSQIVENKKNKKRKRKETDK